jgi:gustatory receptor
MIVYTSLMVINYIDDTFKNSDNLDDDDFFKVVISNINLVLLFIVNNFSQASISFNDDFAGQHFRTDLDVRLRPSRIRKIVKLADNLRRLSTTESPDLEKFTYVVSTTVPEFCVARFFCITRSTIFSTMSTITTFLIVFFQFRQ